MCVCVCEISKEKNKEMRKVKRTCRRCSLSCAVFEFCCHSNRSSSKSLTPPTSGQNSTTVVVATNSLGSSLGNEVVTSTSLKQKSQSLNKYINTWTSHSLEIRVNLHLLLVNLGEVIITSC